MAIPKKGARRINVDGHLYRWLIRRKATHCQTDYGIGKLNIAIESAETCGATLYLVTDRPHPKDHFTVAAVPIQPSHIADWIRQSRQLGWQPDRHASPFLAEVRGDSVGRRP